MDDIARLPAADRSDLFTAASNTRGDILPVLIEKDFWVCWTLKRIFTLSDPPAGLIFKGGTSLSKVYQAIDRFSEDVDLSFDRSALGSGPGGQQEAGHQTTGSPVGCVPGDDPHPLPAQA
ncbi:MAG: nucleotidyl transferase AbiEii/AbiGii toxin family protein [Elusimicrobiota bacterium]